MMVDESLEGFRCVDPLDCKGLHSFSGDGEGSNELGEGYGGLDSFRADRGGVMSVGLGGGGSERFKIDNKDPMTGRGPQRNLSRFIGDGDSQLVRLE